MECFNNYFILVIPAFWCFYVANAQSEFETKLNDLLDEGNITAE